MYDPPSPAFQVHTHRLPQQILTNLQAKIHNTTVDLRLGCVVSPAGECSL